VIRVTLVALLYVSAQPISAMQKDGDGASDLDSNVEISSIISETRSGSGMGDFPSECKAQLYAWPVRNEQASPQEKAGGFCERLHKVLTAYCCCCKSRSRNLYLDNSSRNDDT